MFVDTAKIGADGKSGLEIDLDEQEKISDIHNIIAIDGKFLILANKRRHRVGLYLLAVSMDDPTDVKMILNQLRMANLILSSGFGGKYLIISSRRENASSCAAFLTFCGKRSTTFLICSGVRFISFLIQPVIHVVE